MILRPMSGYKAPARLKVVDMHTAGEPVRIVEAGYPDLRGATILEKRRDALERLDDLRKTMMLEPRGHGGMYGVIPTAACDLTADLAVLFTHQEGYSTMCGHATVAIGRWAVDTGRAAMVDGKASFKLETPCGVIGVEVTQGDADTPDVAFESVDSFASHLDLSVAVPGYGLIHFDIAFGGAYYAILPASRLGLSLMDTPVADLVAAGVAVTNAVRQAVVISHPVERDLGFLYGAILTDDVEIGRDAVPSYNLCVFAEGQIDRSPTGSGVTARLALAAAKGRIVVGQGCEIRGISGQGFIGTLVRSSEGVSRVRVAGQSFYTGRCEFASEPGDPFADGFELPATFRSLEAK